MLQGAIGTFPEEDDAYWVVTTLSWALPLILVISTILDSILVWVYMKHAHPWKGILVDEEKKEAKKLAKEKEKKEKKLQNKYAKPTKCLERHFSDST